MRASHISCLGLALVLGGASTARAASVYLNGVAVDGLANQKFTGATVAFDAKGDVHITAPGIEVKTLTAGQPGAAATSPAAAKPTKHYFLVPQQSVLGMTGYDIDVFLNDTWVTRFRDAEQQNPIDVTKYLKVGSNKVIFTAHKVKGPRKSVSPAHTFTVMVGQGTAGGDQVIIEDPLLTFKRTAAQTDDATEADTFDAR